MYDKLTTGNSTLIVFCFYNTVSTLFASEPVNFELRLTVLNFFANVEHQLLLIGS